MSNIALVWDNENGRGDWQIAGGRTSTGHLLRSAVYISLFTDRVEPADKTGDPRGWWHDYFDGIPIGSRLRDLRRRKVADRQRLINEATDILNEALQWMVTYGLLSRFVVLVSLPAAGIGSSGSMLNFKVWLYQPNAPASLVQALWSAV